MSCQACGSGRLFDVYAKCSDLFHAYVADGYGHDGYVPDDIGIGDGDHVEFTYCLDCGQLEGEWPLPESSLEREIEETKRMEEE